MPSTSKVAKVFINGRLIGFHPSAEALTKELVGARRSDRLSQQVNIAFHADTNEVYVNTDSGRLQRPLIVIENGKSLVNAEHVKAVKEGRLTFTELVRQGRIEYLDAEEEENAHIALNEEEITSKHTHMEISEVGILSVITSLIPYLQHNMAGKNLHGAKMFKQALGLPATNYNLRTDTEGFLLYYPQKELVRTKTSDLMRLDRRPNNQNFVVAIMPFYGYNTLDALILNKGAVERGLGRSAYFRTYEGIETRYPGGQADNFEVPTEETVGFMGNENYLKLDTDGLAKIEAYADGKDVIIGRTSPPRFLEEIREFGVVRETRRESSIQVRKGKPGSIDRVILTENEDGNRLVKIKLRTTMIPEVGDKFSSKHGQKGVIGAIVAEEDMPFTADGMKPDLIINPHSIPSRMTVGHLLETIGGKASCLTGEPVDGTPFNSTPQTDLEEILKTHGFEGNGNEVFYDGITGGRIKGQIFTGVVSYRRLFHMVSHKLQARGRGPVQILTRQPTEGKEKDGGLRFGEMEGETLVGHGASMLLQEKFVDDSDKVVELVSEKSGLIAVNDVIRNKKYDPVSDSSKVYPVEMSYGFKLLLEELKALLVYPKLIIGDKVSSQRDTGGKKGGN